MRRIAGSATIVLVGTFVAWLIVEHGGAAHAGMILFGSLCLALAIGIRPFRRLAFLAIPGLFASGCIASYGANSLRLSHFASQLTESLPPGSEVLASERWIQIFLGNGNHCDYFAEVTVRSDLSLDEFTAYYSAVQPRPAIPGEGGAMPSLEVSEAGSGLYRVEIEDGPYGRNMDIRCT